jgi:hypothetical protein
MIVNQTSIQRIAIYKSILSKLSKKRFAFITYNKYKKKSQSYQQQYWLKFLKSMSASNTHPETMYPVISFQEA